MDYFNSNAKEYSKNYSSLSDIKSIYFRRRLEIVSEEVTKLKPRKILDLGCGSGEISTELGKNIPEVEITIVDKSMEMLKIAEAKLKTIRLIPEIIHASLEKSINIDKQEVILLLGVVAYLANMEEVIKTCHQGAEKNKTKIIIQMSDVNHPIHIVARNIYKLNKAKARSELHYMNLKRRTLKELDREMLKGNFKRIKTKRYGFDMPGIMNWKIRIFKNRFLRDIDRILGTDLMCTYESID